MTRVGLAKWLNGRTISRAQGHVKHVVVVGGGISGLSTAHFLRQSLPGAKVTLLEGSSRCGGWISTQGFPISHRPGEQHDPVQRPSLFSSAGETFSVFERGPRSLRVAGSGSEMLALLEDIGMEKEIMPANKENISKRYIYDGKKVHRMPSTILEALAHPLIRKAIPSILKEPFVKKRNWSDVNRDEKSDIKVVDVVEDGDDESVYDFISRRFGKYVAETLVAPITVGIFCASLKKLSVKYCFPYLVELEDKYGSIVLGLLKEDLFPSPPSPSSPSSPSSSSTSTSAPSSSPKYFSASPELRKPITKKTIPSGVYSFNGGMEALIYNLTRYLIEKSGVEIVRDSGVAKITWGINSAEQKKGGIARCTTRYV